MKCHVVLDERGEIVSAGYIDQPEFEAHELLTPRAGPVPEPGQTVVELDVPAEHARLPLPDFLERLRVDVQAKLPEVKPKKKR